MANANAVASLLRNNLNAVIDAIVDNNPAAVAANLVARNISIGNGTNIDIMHAVAGVLSGGDRQTVANVLAVPFVTGVLPAEYDTAFGVVYAEKQGKRLKSTGTDILDTVGEMEWGSIICSFMGTCPDNNTTINNITPPPFWQTTTGAIVIGGGILLVLLVLFLMFR